VAGKSILKKGRSISKRIYLFISLFFFISTFNAFLSLFHLPLHHHSDHQGQQSQPSKALVYTALAHVEDDMYHEDDEDEEELDSEAETTEEEEERTCDFGDK